MNKWNKSATNKWYVRPLGVMRHCLSALSDLSQRILRPKDFSYPPCGRLTKGPNTCHDIIEKKIDMLILIFIVEHKVAVHLKNNKRSTGIGGHNLQTVAYTLTDSKTYETFV